MRFLPPALPAPARPPLALAPARMHEAGGTGRRTFALFQAMRHPGPVFWILLAHEHQRPLPRGLPPGLAERLVLLTPRTGTDLLWATEESLRGAAAGLVIAEPHEPLSLTAGRRLQLAAEAGRTPALMLIAEGAGSNAAESRWSCAPLAAPAADSTLHHWACIKNKSGTTAQWIVNWNGTSAAFHLAPAVRQRDEPQGAPG